MLEGPSFQESFQQLSHHQRLNKRCPTLPAVPAFTSPLLTPLTQTQNTLKHNKLPLPGATGRAVVSAGPESKALLRILLSTAGCPIPVRGQNAAGAVMGDAAPPTRGRLLKSNPGEQHHAVVTAAQQSAPSESRWGLCSDPTAANSALLG